MEPTINRTMGVVEGAIRLVLSGLWGRSFVFTGVALRELPPLTRVLLRVDLAALILNGAVIATGARMPRHRRTWGAFVVRGGLNNALPFGLIVWGQTHISSGLAAILMRRRSAPSSWRTAPPRTRRCRATAWQACSSDSSVSPSRSGHPCSPVSERTDWRRSRSRASEGRPYVSGLRHGCRNGTFKPRQIGPV